MMRLSKIGFSIALTFVVFACSPTVRFYHWGGSQTINRWLDETAGPQLKKRYGVDLVRVPMDAATVIEKLAIEKKTGLATGTVDVVWINGENFHRAKELGLLRGPITQDLKNFERYVESETVAWDFGTATNGFEAPWGRAQLVFETDLARVPTPVRTLDELKSWIKAHPGRFTYPELPDFTGSAFVRQLFVQLNGGSERFLPGFDERVWNESSAKLWAWLEDVRPSLWNRGRSYPKSVAEMDQLFARGEIDFNINYSQAHAQNKIDEGLYLTTVRSFVLLEGSLSNVHYLAVPFNAPNSTDALKWIDLLLEPELQASKNDPRLWGDFSVLSPSKLSPEELALWKRFDLGAATLSIAQLERAALVEIPARYVEVLEKTWRSKTLGTAP